MFQSQKGFIAISTVLLLSVVIITIATTVALLSIGDAQSSLALYKGEDTLQFVEGCVEDGLLKSQASALYNGGNITRPEGTCVVTTPITKVGNIWTMTVSNNVTTYKRTIQVVFTRTSSSITITSWKEQ